MTDLLPYRHDCLCGCAGDDREHDPEREDYYREQDEDRDAYTAEELALQRQRDEDQRLDDLEYAAEKDEPNAWDLTMIACATELAR